MEHYNDLAQTLVERPDRCGPRFPVNKRHNVRRHGTGAGTVYAYGYASIPDRLRVGKTVGVVVDRIVQQINASTPDKPKLLLEVKTRDCGTFEAVLRGILTLRGCKVHGGGDEWFRATRDDIESILRSLALI